MKHNHWRIIFRYSANLPALQINKQSYGWSLSWRSLLSLFHKAPPKPLHITIYPFERRKSRARRNFSSPAVLSASVFRMTQIYFFFPFASPSIKRGAENEEVFHLAARWGVWNRIGTIMMIHIYDKIMRK